MAGQGGAGGLRCFLQRQAKIQLAEPAPSVLQKWYSSSSRTTTHSLDVLLRDGLIRKPVAAEGSDPGVGAKIALACNVVEEAGLKVGDVEGELCAGWGGVGWDRLVMG